MDNFKAKTYDKGKRTKFVYYPAESGKMIKISISHRDGGQNYFSGGNEKRGVEVSISQIELSDSGVRGIMMESIMPFDDVNGRLLVLETARFSQKKVEAVAEAFDAKAPEISRLWTEDRAAARALLFETAELAKAA